MTIKVVDIEKFLLNQHIKLNEKYIGNHHNKIVVGNNFFSDPDFIRNYALNQIYIDEYNHRDLGYRNENTHWYTHKFPLDYKEYSEFLNWIKIEIYKDINPHYGVFSNKSNFQYYDKIGENIPHVDPFRFAGVVSLNTESELKDTLSGTKFFRIKETGEENIEHNSYKDKLITENCTIDDFEEYHLQEHSFNTLIIYPSTLLHSPFANYLNWNSKIKRLTFNIFFW